MRKKINGVLYDTTTASLIAFTESTTALSGNLSVRLFKSQDGQWFQTVSPVSGNGRPTISNWIGPNTARLWLEKYSFSRQIREHFGISDNRLQPERQILVAEWKSPYSTTPHELVQIDRLYHHPQKGWCLKQTKGAVRIPLTGTEAAKLARTLQFGGGQIQSSLPYNEMSLSIGDPLYHRSQTL